MSEPRVALLRWVAACTMAEVLGIAVVSVTYAALDRNLIAPAAPWILLAGGWEGLCLGSAQAFFLRRLRINPALWIGLTIAGAIVGYGLSLLGGAGAEDAGSAYDPPLWMMAVLGAGVGLGMGVAMGVIQMPAMAVIMAAAGLAERSWSLLQVAFAGGLSGGVAGLCVGAATGFVLMRAT